MELQRIIPVWAPPRAEFDITVRDDLNRPELECVSLIVHAAAERHITEHVTMGGDSQWWNVSRSIYPSHQITAAGAGGMITFKDEKAYSRASRSS
jgi:hypothetical protein